MFVYTLFGLLLLTMGCSTRRISRLLTHPAKDGEIPYQVSLQTRDRHFCGGTIIEPTWILTAANCVYGKLDRDIEVIAGMTKLNGKNEITGQMRRVLAIVIHEEYENTGPGFTNDIALLKLNQPLEFNSLVRKIDLPVDHSWYPKGYANASQWGPIVGPSSNESVQLHRAVMKIEPSPSYCDGIALDSNMEYYMEQFPLKFCATSSYKKVERYKCDDDSGGPLTQYANNGRLVVVGVTSWRCKPCSKGTDGVYINVVKFTNWINTTIASARIHRYLKRSAMKRLLRRA